MATSRQLSAHRLVYSVLLVNLFFYFLAGVALYQNYKQYEVQTALTTENLAHSLEINVSSIIDKFDVAVFAVADEVERQLSAGVLNTAAISEYLNRQHRHSPEFESIRYANEHGDVTFTEQLSTRKSVNVSDRDYFLIARDNPDSDLITSRPYVSRVNQKWVVILARRVNNPNGTFGGVAFGVLSLEYLSQIFSSLDIGKHGVISLRDENMALIVRVPEHEGIGRSVGNNVVSAETSRIVAAHPEGSSYETIVKLDNIKRRMSFRKISGQNWYLFVGQAVSDYLALWWNEVVIVLLLAIAFTLTTIFAARIIFRRREAELLAIEVLRNSKEDLQRSETKFRTLYDSTSDAVCLFDKNGLIDCNRATLNTFGCTNKEELYGKHLADLSPVMQPCSTASRTLSDEKLAHVLDSGNLRFEWAHMRFDTKESFPAEVLLSAVALDGKRIVQAVIRDITERKQAEEKIRYLAYFDALTKLPNRRLMLDRLGHAVVTSKRMQTYAALMILDIDKFKALNDTHGHDMGDRLLVQVAERISAVVLEENTVSRLGGDEYVIMLEGLGKDELAAAKHVETIAEKILYELHKPYPIFDDGQTYHATASIGVALFCRQNLSVDNLLKQAEVALYQAKGAGRDTVRFFNPEMQATIDSISAMEAALRNGLERDEFRLFYQPQVDHDGHLIGAEALLRWFPQGHASVSPATFIPLAEDTGLIVPIGLWVMHTAFAQINAWSGDAKTRNLKLAINVSALQFRQPDFVKQVCNLLKQYDINPTLLKLELTESVVLNDVEEIIKRMHQLKALGVSFSLDDFGTGFSSLSYLKRLPLDQVKIDQSFIRDVTIDSNDAAIVRAIIAMSQSLGMQVIAEGVETPGQKNFLRENGCTCYQGYLFGRPAPIEDWDMNAFFVIQEMTVPT